MTRSANNPMPPQSLQMAYSNANYLISPTRLSTKVHHAPGGTSSLSLAWEDPEKPKRDRSKKDQPQQYKPSSEPPNFIHSRSQMSKEQAQFMHKNYYEPAYPGFLNMSESNRLLEEELRYYQNRNKALRNNLFASQEEKDLRSGYSGDRQQYSYEFGNNKNSEDDYFSRSQDYGRGRRTEELDMAILQQQKKRAYQRHEYSGIYGMGQMGGQIVQKPSVKVSNPPGGKSSIVFG